MPSIDDVPAICERVSFELSIPLSSWQERIEAVCAEVSDIEEAGAIVAAAVVRAYYNISPERWHFWCRALPRLLTDVWGCSPVSADARRGLMSIARKADAREAIENN
jgi:hypothetical protein